MTAQTLSSVASPFLHSPRSTRWIMWQAVIALLPIGILGVVLFGHRALFVIGVCVVTSLAADWISVWASGRRVDIVDASPLVTGLLLGYTLPPGVPWYVPFVGALYSIWLGKQLFGGLGRNLFNPALVGRVLLQWSYPDQLNLLRYPVPMDAVSAASPLYTTTGAQQAGLWELLLGMHGGAIGETSAILISVCGLYLVLRGIIQWKPPVYCLLSAFVVSLLLPAPEKFAGHAHYLIHNPLYHLLSGGLILTAFFFVTDPVTTPLTPLGRIIFAISVGAITVFIRFYGIYPEGVAYAVLILNAFTPLLNQWTARKPL